MEDALAGPIAPFTSITTAGGRGWAASRRTPANSTAMIRSSRFRPRRPGEAAPRLAIGLVLRQRFGTGPGKRPVRSEEHTSELQSLMRTSYAVFCLKKKTHQPTQPPAPLHSHPHA